MRAILLSALLALADADCGWVHTCGPRGCLDCKNDGSPGYYACCGHSPSPPRRRGGPPSPPTPGANYCPDAASDFKSDYGGNLQWQGSGWTIHGGARASSKASFDLSGGFIEFDMQLSGAHGGVNNNVYITFPTSPGGRYCDSGAGTPGPGCAELDFIENNGHCAAATTWHTDPGGGDHGGKQTVNGIGTSVRVKAEWDGGGDTLTVHVDGHVMSGQGNPGNQMKSRGAVIYSSQWTGWVPGSCGGDGNLGASSFSVSNLRIKGRVVNGQAPKKCGAEVGNSSIVV